MLMERIGTGVRVQCGSCGAHAVMGVEDYADLVEHEDGHMRCEVCGYHVLFSPTEPAGRERDRVVSR
jgi:hypothetical protein